MDGMERGREGGTATTCPAVMETKPLRMPLQTVLTFQVLLRK